MKIIPKKFVQIVIELLLIIVFIQPVISVSAQTDIPVDEPATAPEGESTQAADDPAPADEESASAEEESGPAEEASAVEEETAAAEDETPAQEEPALIEDEAAVQEEADTPEEEQPPSDDEATAQEEADTPEEEAESTGEDLPLSDDETATEGNASQDDPAPENETTSTEDEAAEDGPAQTEEADDVQEETMSDTPTIVELVQQMAGANAQLIDENGQTISLASEEAAELLGQNSEQVSDIILLSTSSVIAQDNADQLDGGNDGVGQSFTATVSGSLTQIEIASNSTGSFTLKIYLGAPTSGAQLYSQAVTLTDTVNNTGGVVNSFTYQTINITNPVAVTQGQLYSFGIEGVMPAMAVDTAGGGSSYTGGDLYTLNAGTWSVSLNRDMAFRAHIVQSDSKASETIIEDEEIILRAQFIRKPDDYKLIPDGLRIQGILFYNYEYGYVDFNLPAGIPSDDVTIMFWNGSSWSNLPGVITIENGIQGPAVGPGTYVMVVR